MSLLSTATLPPFPDPVEKGLFIRGAALGRYLSMVIETSARGGDLSRTISLLALQDKSYSLSISRERLGSTTAMSTSAPKVELLTVSTVARNLLLNKASHMLLPIEKAHT